MIWSILDHFEPDTAGKPVLPKFRIPEGETHFQTLNIEPFLFIYPKFVQFT